MATREAWKEGFEGEVARMGLPDLIQVSAHNRFSGCITVQYDDLRGLIFFRDGAVVHAEQGEKVGEEAFHDILSWPGGRFSQQPSLSTTRATIHKACEHLLLDSHRVMDERRAAGKAEPPPLPQEAPRQVRGGAVVEQLRRIGGVTALAVQGKDGARLGSRLPGSPARGRRPQLDRSPVRRRVILLSPTRERRGGSRHPHRGRRPPPRPLPSAHPPRAASRSARESFPGLRGGSRRRAAWSCCTAAGARGKASPRSSNA